MSLPGRLVGEDRHAQQDGAAATASPLELYVYYRIPSARQAEALALVQAWQAGLRREHPALTARLLHRTDDRDPAEKTWMETYAAADGGLVAALRESLAAGPPGLAAIARGERHAEPFVPCAS